MPDFQKFKLTRSGNVSKTLPQIMVELEVRNDRTGALIVDFTGANAFSLWDAIASLTPAQQVEAITDLVHKVIRLKAGLD